jgi:hypothetical protein
VEKGFLTPESPENHSAPAWIVFEFVTLDIMSAFVPPDLSSRTQLGIDGDVLCE